MIWVVLITKITLRTCILSETGNVSKVVGIVSKETGAASVGN